VREFFFGQIAPLPLGRRGDPLDGGGKRSLALGQGDSRFGDHAGSSVIEEPLCDGGRRVVVPGRSTGE
jgi:hypothetical protein